MTITQTITQKLTEAFTLAGISEFSPQVGLASRPDFGDYQANGIMAAAKSLKTNPRSLANTVKEHINLSDIVDKLEIAGPGFINIHLAPEFLANFLQALIINELKNTPENSTQPKEKIMVEYSSPNLAKEMHVGHLRSTIIGDSLARVYEFLGFEVIRANHVGDWGTQFGMLIAYLADFSNDNKSQILLNDLEDFYRKAKEKFDGDNEFAERARGYVVRLQSGDTEVLKLWHEFVQTSMSHCLATYKVLGVGLTNKHTYGESAYNNDLDKVVDELQNAKLLVENGGAKVVFLPNENSSDEKQVMIIQKKDGGYLYSTTDIAAIRYRHKQLQLNRVLYVVDSRQALHFVQLFRLCKLAKFVPPNMQLEHIAFGMVLGDDGKPFKTRDGGTVKLSNLLSEANERAYKIVREKNPEHSDKWCKNIASVVGIGAVKYADLSKNRQSDYIFSWNSMLSFEGNTAPYLQYAYTRIQSVFRKAENKQITHNTKIILNRDEKTEWQLALSLAQFNEVVENVADTCQPHHLCCYLYNIATLFSRFYESCPILKADPDIQASRLQIAKLTGDTLRQGLDLLGINVLDEM